MWIHAKHGDHKTWAASGIPTGNGGGIGNFQWLNPAGGGAYLLHPTGPWERGGEYELYYLRPGAETAINVTRQFFSEEKNSYPAEPDGWQDVLNRCIAHVSQTLGNVITITPL